MQTAPLLVPRNYAAHSPALVLMLADTYAHGPASAGVCSRMLLELQRLQSLSDEPHEFDFAVAFVQRYLNESVHLVGTDAPSRLVRVAGRVQLAG